MGRHRGGLVLHYRGLSSVFPVALQGDACVLASPPLVDVQAKVLRPCRVEGSGTSPGAPAGGPATARESSGMGRIMEGGGTGALRLDLLACRAHKVGYLLQPTTLWCFARCADRRVSEE